MKIILKLIELLMQLFQRFESSKHEERKKDAKRDPVKYFNTLNGVRDKPKKPADSPDNKQ